MRRLTAFSKNLGTRKPSSIVRILLIALTPVLVACDEAAGDKNHITPVLIFSHGTHRPQVRHQCNPQRDIPPVTRVVADGAGYRLHYLCSKAVDGKEAGSYTYKRAEEIKKVVESYRSRGVPAKKIFLVGYSAGGWSSLLASRDFGHRFNAVIAFAPAFAGPRHEIRIYPWWRRRIRPRQVSHLQTAARIPALVFAFPDDTFNRPQELSFLKEIDGVKLVTINHCRNGHKTPLGRCFEKAAAARMAKYIESRLGR